jgi:hypothetical protein
MKNGVRIALIITLAFFFASHFLTISRAQKLFSHSTPAHREKQFSDCKTCHFITTDWDKRPRVDKQSPFPDITNFPYNLPNAKLGDKHTACFGCHSSDGFKNGGVFCQVCHVDAGFKARPGTGVRQFPVLPRPTQFVTIFPHDAHQDIIASNRMLQDVAVGHFTLARFSTADEKKTDFYYCAICHKPAQTLPKFTERVPITDEKPPAAAPDNFKPKPDYFKDAPMNHTACFTCHYQRTQPISTNCAGCHKLAEKPYVRSTVVARYSLKFDHDSVDKDGKKVHNQDCITCHLSLPGSSDLQALKNKKEPEVTFGVCAKCHETTGEIPEEKKKRSENKNYQCSFCHTSAVGRYKLPASHQ